MRGGYLLPAVALATALGGCGTMRVTAADPSAKLYAGGRMLGKGTGEIKRRGMPESTTITAVTEDGRRTQTVARREFTAFTFVTGLVTYGVCLFACWEYPSALYVAVPPQPSYQGVGAGNPDDLWLRPPAGWQPKATTPAAAPAPGTPTPPPAAPAGPQ